MTRSEAQKLERAAEIVAEFHENLENVYSSLGWEELWLEDQLREEDIRAAEQTALSMTRGKFSVDEIKEAASFIKDNEYYYLPPIPWNW